jgi:two-component system CheB/CheR fusion protein
VDDWPDTAESFCTVVTLWGYEAVTARDGRDAVALATKFRPDVVLLDLGLPELDGFAVANLLRTLPGFERLPFIVVTGHTDARYRREAERAGFEAYLLKPCDLDELAGHLARVTSPGEDAPALLRAGEATRHESDEP